MKNVMVRAWEIARKAVVKFGGKIKEYFAQALAMAWKENKKGVNKMVKLEGSEKQVVWANEIREAYMQYCGKVKELIERGNTKNKDFSGQYEAIENQTSAKFWIDWFQYLTKKEGDKVSLILDVMYDLPVQPEFNRIRFNLAIQKAKKIKYEQDYLS